MKKRIEELLPEFFINGWKLDRNQKLEVEYVDGTAFLKSERLDLVSKLFYIDSREKKRNIQLAKELYREHLRAFTKGTFQEPGSEEKNSLQQYYRAFDELIEDAKMHGLCAERSVVPVGNNDSILDGSHRTAIAIYYHLPLPVVRISGIQKTYNYEFFKSRGLKQRYLDFMAYLFLLYSENSYVAFLWPRADRRRKRILAEQCMKETAGIVYRKRFWLRLSGLLQLMILVYGNQEWAGTKENHFPGLWRKAKNCYCPFRFTTVYVLTGAKQKEIVFMKDKIRKIYQIGNHSIHITDTKKEAVEAGKEIFCDGKTRIP